MTNDWQTNGNIAEIYASGRAPANAKEAALLITLQPNTPIVYGANNTEGVALVEVYEME